ncbi:carbon-nitrogen hydrolase [Parasitella parasitica]|nr:carbon-nitrogen hydrolase [Parasitella parasitica]
MKELIKAKINEHWLLMPFILIIIFGFGYQAIPLFSWFYFPIALLYTRHQPTNHILIVYIISSICMGLSFLGNFRMVSDGPRFPGAWITILLSLVIHLFLLIALFAEKYVLSRQHCIKTRVLLLPCIWTGLWTLLVRYGAVGDYPSMTTALVTWPDFAQIAELGGRSLLDFLVALFGTSILEIGSLPLQCLSANDELLQNSSISATAGNDDEENSNQHTRPPHKKQYRSLLTHPVTVFSGIIALALTYGGARVNIHSGSFYQSTYPQYVPKTEQVGCVVGPGSEFPGLQAQHDIWFNHTASLAEAGAKLIIWSELTASVNDMDEEFEFLQRAKMFASTHKVYLGVTYAAVDPVGQNKFVFITKEGEIAIDYKKAHPVPGIETQPPGPPVLQYVDTDEFGRVSGAICFDYNFPQFISQASSLNVDLMLQPSWTWGPIGTYHQQTNTLRAVENGFTLFRCVSQGESGIYEPTLNGIFNQKVASINAERYLFSLPLQKRAATLYGYIGDSFGFFCLALGIVLLLQISRNTRRGRLSLD